MKGVRPTPALAVFTHKGTRTRTRTHRLRGADPVLTLRQGSRGKQEDVEGKEQREEGRREPGRRAAAARGVGESGGKGGGSRRAAWRATELMVTMTALHSIDAHSGGRQAGRQARVIARAATFAAWLAACPVCQSVVCRLFRGVQPGRRVAHGEGGERARLAGQQAGRPIYPHHCTPPRQAACYQHAHSALLLWVARTERERASERVPPSLPARLSAQPSECPLSLLLTLFSPSLSWLLAPTRLGRARAPRPPHSLDFCAIWSHYTVNEPTPSSGGQTAAVSSPLPAVCSLHLPINAYLAWQTTTTTTALILTTVQHRVCMRAKEGQGSDQRKAAG